MNYALATYVATGYTHMDIMQAIIASVYTYIVVGEFKGQLIHLSSPLGCTLWMKYLGESTDGVCDNCSAGTIVSGSCFW